MHLSSMVRTTHWFLKTQRPTRGHNHYFTNMTAVTVAIAFCWPPGCSSKRTTLSAHNVCGRSCTLTSSNWAQLAPWLCASPGNTIYYLTRTLVLVYWKSAHGIGAYLRIRCNVSGEILKIKSMQSNIKLYSEHIECRRCRLLLRVTTCTGAVSAL